MLESDRETLASLTLLDRGRVLGLALPIGEMSDGVFFARRVTQRLLSPTSVETDNIDGTNMLLTYWDC